MATAWNPPDPTDRVFEHDQVAEYMPERSISDKRMEELLRTLAAIARSLAAIERALRPEAPNYKRDIKDFPNFNWENIGARVLKRDAYGVAQVEYSDQVYTRRSPDNKFDEAIWFSRPEGKDADGNVRYVRLITFRKFDDAEPIGRKVEAVIRATAKPPEAAAGPTITTASAAGAAVRAKLQKMAATLGGQDDQPASDDQRQRAFNNLRALCGNNDAYRHAVIEFVFGKKSMTELTAGEAQAIRDWIAVRKHGNEWVPSSTAIDDLKAIMQAVSVA